jgi:hypothetical protein
LAERRYKIAHEILWMVQMFGLGRPPRPRTRGGFTVHYRKTGYNSNGFTIVEDAEVVSTEKGGAITTGPVLVDGTRKFKCNVHDNATGRWVRRDYPQLQDWKKGLKIIYHDDGTSTEQPWGRALQGEEEE